VKLIAAKNPEHLPTVVTGDMNSSRATKPSNGAYSVYMHGGLTDPLGNANDTWFATVAGPAEQRIDVNYNSFNGMARTAAYTKYAVGTHVDYILTANVARVAQVRTVVNLNRAGKFIGTFASDHNMLTAYINLH
jgi:endonuclease/exonuclease/phosphatase family metal-dependent hydrolase